MGICINVYCNPTFYLRIFKQIKETSNFKRCMRFLIVCVFIAFGILILLARSLINWNGTYYSAGFTLIIFGLVIFVMEFNYFLIFASRIKRNMIQADDETSQLTQNDRHNASLWYRCLPNKAVYYVCPKQNPVITSQISRDSYNNYPQKTQSLPRNFKEDRSESNAILKRVDLVTNQAIATKNCLDDSKEWRGFFEEKDLTSLKRKTPRKPINRRLSDHFSARQPQCLRNKSCIFTHKFQPSNDSMQHNTLQQNNAILQNAEGSLISNSNFINTEPTPNELHSRKQEADLRQHMTATYSNTDEYLLNNTAHMLNDYLQIAEGSVISNSNFINTKPTPNELYSKKQETDLRQHMTATYSNTDEYLLNNTAHMLNDYLQNAEGSVISNSNFINTKPTPNELHSRKQEIDLQRHMTSTYSNTNDLMNNTAHMLNDYLQNSLPQTNVPLHNQQSFVKENNFNESMPCQTGFRAAEPSKKSQIPASTNAHESISSTSTVKYNPFSQQKEHHININS